ncbi:phosphodiester glycosidase family protein [Parafilimonas sp.]|uniref:phosphodiester glycosidase family protein n=1 Tax=Parafilimonas sp. TaxID=1969739 RepID=UPI0039E3FA40
MRGKQQHRFYSLTKAAIVLAVCACHVISAKAQTDSATVVNAKWNAVHVAPGIILKQCWFDSTLFHSSQNISILEVKLSRKNHAGIGSEAKQLKPTHEYAQERNAVAAINGTFFNMKEGGSEDYIRSNGKAINATLVKDGQRSFHQQAAITISRNKVNIVQWDSTAAWEDNLPGKEVMVSGPLLVYKNKIIEWPLKTGFFGRNPRSVLAMRKKKLYLIAVDGRNEKAAGMSIAELSLLMHWLKMYNAINLDGGGSTTLWVKNYPYGGVVNHPSDNHQWLHSDAYKPGMDLDNLPADTTRWDHTGERPVANVILIERR